MSKRDISPVKAGLAFICAFGAACGIAVSAVSPQNKARVQEAQQKETVYDREPTYSELLAYAKKAEGTPQTEENVVEGVPDPSNSSKEDASWKNDSDYINARLLDCRTIGSDTRFFVSVDRETFRTVVFFKDDDGDWKAAAEFDCGVGKANKEVGDAGDPNESHTFAGTFKVDHKYERCGGLEYFTVYVPCWDESGDNGQGFHNLYLGYPGRYSQGCVRLTDENAKWLYDNVPVGSTVYVF